MQSHASMCRMFGLKWQVTIMTLTTYDHLSYTSYGPLIRTVCSQRYFIIWMFKTFAGASAALLPIWQFCNTDRSVGDNVICYSETCIVSQNGPHMANVAFFSLLMVNSSFLLPTEDKCLYWMPEEAHAAITLLMESQRYKLTCGWGNFPMALTKEEVLSESRQRITSQVTKYFFLSTARWIDLILPYMRALCLKCREKTTRTLRKYFPIHCCLWRITRLLHVNTYNSFMLINNSNTRFTNQITDFIK